MNKQVEEVEGMLGTDEEEMQMDDQVDNDHVPNSTNASMEDDKFEEVVPKTL